MHLEFTDEQEALREAVRDMLERECPTSVVRSLVEQGTYPDDLWKQMVDLDWPLLCVPEASGGVGLGFVEMAVVAEELGRRIAPSPFESVATQYQPLLHHLDHAIGSPATLGTVGFARTTATLRTRDGDAARLDGSARWVFDATAATEMLVVATADHTGKSDGPPVAVARVALDAPGVTVTRVRPFDPTRRVAHVTFSSTPAAIVGLPGEQTARAIARTVEEATTVIALETVGTCDTIFAMALQYAKDRHQFGVPIGSFQAIKHKLADMFVALERARVTAYFAAAAIAEEDDRRSLAVSMAKAAAGDAQRVIAQEAIQIHGGIGFTWEHDLHLFVKRAKGGDALFGTAAEHRARVAALLAHTPG